MSKQDAQKARSSYHSSKNAASQVNTGVTFTRPSRASRSPQNVPDSGVAAAFQRCAQPRARHATAY
jgi:hypothetical protein